MANQLVTDLTTLIRDLLTKQEFEQLQANTTAEYGYYDVDEGWEPTPTISPNFARRVYNDIGVLIAEVEKLRSLVQTTQFDYIPTRNRYQTKYGIGFLAQQSSIHDEWLRLEDIVQMLYDASQLTEMVEMLRNQLKSSLESLIARL